MNSVVCFGEVLWDVFPEHKKIGGAPLNVACKFAKQNYKVSLISAIGKDALGEQIQAYLTKECVSTKHIQQLEIKTGTVSVTLSQTGEASYTIEENKAWDYIALNKENIELVKNSSIFIYGSLAARNSVSKHTLEQLLSLANYKVFDVNIRPPYADMQTIHHFLHKADFAKFNNEELYKVSKSYDSCPPESTIEDLIIYISKKTDTNSICVTKGEEGAILYTNNIFYYHGGFKVEIEDTVGCGDSFLATLIHELHHNTNPQQALTSACAMGALVASYKGANPSITQDQIHKIMQ